MPLAGPSRWFLTAALIHLAAVGVLISLGPWDGILAANWDALLWLLLVGFVGFTTIGFSLHLFPPISRRLLPVGPLERATFPLGEAGVVVGTLALVWPTPWILPAWIFAVGASLFAMSVVCVLSLLVHAIEGPRLPTHDSVPRPGDLVTIPLFLASWVAATAAVLLFALSGLSQGPGFGWWLAAVHTFVLGHVVLLVVAVSLRLVPRSLNSDPPPMLAVVVGSSAIVGAITVPAGMLLSNPATPSLLEWLAAPEALAAVGLIAVLILLGLRARVRRPQLALHLVGAAFFLIGGGAGLWMLSNLDYAAVEAHALVNLLGFVGLTILLMWFGMIAPFQRISHAWTNRMMWTLSAVWVSVVLGLAAMGLQTGALPSWSFEVTGGLLLGTALAWILGTLPVLYPTLNPLPGVDVSRLRELRERRKGA